MRRGNQSDIDVNGLRASQAFKFPFLQRAKQLGLQVHADIANLIQKKGTAVGQLEAADASASGRR